jgi:hypothetical protein
MLVISIFVSILLTYALLTKSDLPLFSYSEDLATTIEVNLDDCTAFGLSTTPASTQTLTYLHNGIQQSLSNQTPYLSKQLAVKACKAGLAKH